MYVNRQKKGGQIEKGNDFNPIWLWTRDVESVSPVSNYAMLDRDIPGVGFPRGHLLALALPYHQRALDYARPDHRVYIALLRGI